MSIKWEFEIFMCCLSVERTGYWTLVNTEIFSLKQTFDNGNGLSWSGVAHSGQKLV